MLPVPIPRLAVFALLLLGLPAHAANLDARQALDKAIAVLLGVPYGRNETEVAKHIVASQLVKRGEKGWCGKANYTSWEFHVRVADAAPGEPGSPAAPLDGYIALNANSGELSCATLPYLD